MYQSERAEERKRQEGAFSRTVDRVRSTHTGLPFVGGPIREWNSGVFSARTMINDQPKLPSFSSSSVLPSIPEVNTAVEPVEPAELLVNSTPKQFSSTNDSETLKPSVDTSAFFDNQTQAYNFRYMVRRIEQELNRSRYFNRQTGILVVAIDTRALPTVLDRRPKTKALEAVAISLFNAVRCVDLIGRYTEERFIILCPEMDVESVTALAESIRQSCANTIIKHEWQDISLSVSIGMAVSSPQLDELESLLAVADIGADMALQLGGNRVYRY